MAAATLSPFEHKSVEIGVGKGIKAEAELPEMEEAAGARNLKLYGVIGFNGGVPEGFILHPDDEHIIYPLGSTVVVRNLLTHTQHFLQKGGHDRPISCLALSPSGKFLASGQVSHMGFSAEVIVWNLETCEAVHKLKLHKGKVEAVAFSAQESYLASVGGTDDRRLIVWDVKTGEAICGGTVANDDAYTVKFFNHDERQLVTGGDYNLRVWSIDPVSRKVQFTDCALGSLKRTIRCMTIDDKDQFMYCGTDTGDILKVNLTHKLMQDSGPAKKLFVQGVKSITKTPKGHLLIGTGEGVVAVVNKDTLKTTRTLALSGGVSSLQMNAAGDHFFVGTKECNIYLVHYQSFEFELRDTCHSASVNDVAFAKGYSELFATCSGSDIRVWQSATCAELLRIQVPNLVCLCVDFMPDGKSIVSGWNDGKIRAFLPQSGKLKYAITDAHRNDVTAITCTSNSKYIISGGSDGQVRVWEIGKSTQKMVASMKEHKLPVTFIQVNKDDSECVSSANDGSCIVWSLERFVRNNCLFASTQFKAVQYHPDQSQLLTTGTDRKITYWDAVDGNPIRIMDGSTVDEVNTLAIAADGERFVSGGMDKLVKVWSYDEGYCYYRGVGHSGGITRVKISPDQRYIVSCGNEGAVFIWELPHWESPSH